MSKRDRLEREARDRWDEDWYLSHYIDADGDERWYAAHTERRVQDGIVIRQQLSINNSGEMNHNRWLIDEKSYLGRIPEALDPDTLRVILNHDP